MGQLQDKQIKFAQLVSQLIAKAYNLGYGVTLGDAYRDPRCPYGSEVSLHKVRLAIDLNLFIRVDNVWKFLDKTEDHKVLGMWWEQLDPECAWGGRFNDGNHYSLKHEGRK
jgi:hypothetical protein